jgi:hypothetical protein
MTTSRVRVRAIERCTAIVVGAVLLCTAASTAHADTVLDWNRILFTTLTGQNPFNAARIAAATHVAIFEAVNAIRGSRQPYTGTVGAPHGASADAAAAVAGHDVLVHYFPAAAATLDAALEESLATVPDGNSKTDGITVGHAAATAVIALRQNDGSAPPQFFFPSSGAPGEWQLTPSCPAAGGILYHWQNLIPFGVKESSQFRSAPPPALTSLRYRRDFNEVKAVGGVNSTKRSDHLTTVAQFYNAALAPAVWNDVARQLATEQHTRLATNARAFALLNMAISDGLMTSMETKYHYLFWRPETAIHAADIDGNRKTEADPAFTPLITTPCFPSYPSAHAAGSYAGRQIVELFWGRRRHQVALSIASLPGVTLEYTSLDDITDDIDNARIYGGIHFRFDQQAGATMGRRIGLYIFSQYFRRW